MKFFKCAIDYASSVLSPTAALWVFMYSMPNAIISMGGNETNGYHPDGYNSSGHAFIAAYATGFVFIAINAAYCSCYNEDADQSDDEENPSESGDQRLIEDDTQYNPYGAHFINAIGDTGDHLLEEVVNYSNS